jgi:DUF2075 family protein
MVSEMRWNTTTTDWINSPKSVEEVGSIHTVQGYDLNYVGVIIGNDLRYDPAAGKLVFDRTNYHDKKGRENNPKLGIKYTDEDLLEYVKNIYSVLLTRGIRGTYVYICDPAFLGFEVDNDLSSTIILCNQRDPVPPYSLVMTH